MAKKQDAPKTTYRIIRGIKNDTLSEQHEAGATGVDLSKWPQDIIKRWIERGIIEVEDERQDSSS